MKLRFHRILIQVETTRYEKRSRLKTRYGGRPILRSSRCRVRSETTGLDVRKDRVVQYALIGSDVDGSTITVDSLVNPQQHIPSNSSAVHGITDSRSAGTFMEHAVISVKS